MKTIFKYPLQVTDHQTFFMPQGAKILCVDVQHGTPCLWAKVDLNACVNEPRSFVICGTGEKIHRDDLEYVGTFMMASEHLVWHLFEVKNEL